MINYFKDCSTFIEAKKKYRELAKIHHPDVGGDATTMSEITKQYDAFNPQKSNENTNNFYDRSKNYSSNFYNKYSYSSTYTYNDLEKTYLKKEIEELKKVIRDLEKQSNANYIRDLKYENYLLQQKKEDLQRQLDTIPKDIKKIIKKYEKLNKMFNSKTFKELIK